MRRTQLITRIRKNDGIQTCQAERWLVESRLRTRNSLEKLQTATAGNPPVQAWQRYLHAAHNVLLGNDLETPRLLLRQRCFAFSDRHQTATSFSYFCQTLPSTAGFEWTKHLTLSGKQPNKARAFFRRSSTFRIRCPFGVILTTTATLTWRGCFPSTPDDSTRRCWGMKHLSSVYPSLRQRR